ncbi:hypothetical protein CEXT_374131 [Caerostris extrusa]|uniref:Uncharacterized protein n=1 Tax=Caerostris extrusa TaxID=172846 RepID=A0AAV4TGA0_CAEEX|nr:hypothetical protein CEXT_374131 [Caerostris extrusa]
MSSRTYLPPSKSECALHFCNSKHPSLAWSVAVSSSACGSERRNRKGFDFKSSPSSIPKAEISQHPPHLFPPFILRELEVKNGKGTSHSVLCPGIKYPPGHISKSKSECALHFCNSKTSALAWSVAVLSVVQERRNRKGFG